MPRLFGFPWRYGSVPSSAPSVVTAETPASRWGNVSGAAKGWGALASGTKRFEHVRWAFGRREWNGGVLSGQLNFVIDQESGFRIAENTAAVIASESTLNG